MQEEPLLLFTLPIPKKHKITAHTYSWMIFSQRFLSDRQSIIKQMGSLFVFVLVPTWVKDRQDNDMKLEHAEVTETR